MTETVLITGGTGVFGSQMVADFCEMGYQVIFTTTSPSRGEALLDKIRGTPKVDFIVVDLLGKRAAEEICSEITKRGLKVNHLINNARSLKSLSVSLNGLTERETFQAEFTMNVIAPYELTMELASLTDRSLQTVTNVGSQYGVVAANRGLYSDYPNDVPIQYGVSKAALMHLTKELAVRLADRGIRVNCVAYGGVEGRADDEFVARYKTLSPSRRMLKVEEVTGPVLSLISAKNSAVTGQTLVADAGWTLW